MTTLISNSQTKTSGLSTSAISTSHLSRDIKIVVSIIYTLATVKFKYLLCPYLAFTLLYSLGAKLWVWDYCQSEKLTTYI